LLSAFQKAVIILPVSAPHMQLYPFVPSHSNWQSDVICGDPFNYTCLTLTIILTLIDMPMPIALLTRITD
jgi:hypothetical protein